MDEDPTIHIVKSFDDLPNAMEIEDTKELVIQGLPANPEIIHRCRFGDKPGAV